MSFSYELKLGPKIGEGFFGDVHEAQDNVHGKVAVKVLRPYPGECPSAWAIRREALLEEAQNLKAAEHDNIVRVLALVRADADDRLHMVVEFCGEGSFQKKYEAGPMQIFNVKKVLTDICRGVACIHSRNMIHRDIKPGNILGSNKRAKLGDFGLVSNDLVNGYASAQGYSDHLAPEVHKDDLTSAQSDIWALGMTIYRLLHGHAFYQQKFVKAGIDIEASIKNGGFAAKLPWLPHVPLAWRKFIRKAMHDSTLQRFKTAFAMCQAAAPLPTEPRWDCVYTPVQTVWTRQKAGRLIRVSLEAVSATKFVWSAASSANGRSYSLGASDAPDSLKNASQSLEAFFSSSI